MIFNDSTRRQSFKRLLAELLIAASNGRHDLGRRLPGGRCKSRPRNAALTADGPAGPAMARGRRGDQPVSGRVSLF